MRTFLGETKPEQQQAMTQSISFIKKLDGIHDLIWRAADRLEVENVKRTKNILT